MEFNQQPILLQNPLILLFFSHLFLYSSILFCFALYFFSWLQFIAWFLVKNLEKLSVVVGFSLFFFSCWRLEWAAVVNLFLYWPSWNCEVRSTHHLGQQTTSRPQLRIKLWRDLYDFAARVKNAIKSFPIRPKVNGVKCNEVKCRQFSKHFPHHHSYNYYYYYYGKYCES